jgi:uncharacterized membrane protein YuzA (DUF378 family)
MTHTGKHVAIFLFAAFVAATAVYGAIFIVPTMPREWILFGPFSDYTVPALALGLFVGGTALLAAIAITWQPWAGALASMLAGCVIVAFELIEIGVVGLSVVVVGPGQVQSWVQIAYMIIGIAQVVIGYRLWLATATTAPSISHLLR